MTPDRIDEARRRLLGLRRAPGAWSYRPGTSMAVEPSAMAGLALLATDPSADGPGRAVALESSRSTLGHFLRRQSRLAAICMKILDTLTAGASITRGTPWLFARFTTLGSSGT